MKKTQAIIASVVLLIGFHAGAQDAKRITATTNTRLTTDIIHELKEVDLTRKPFVAEEFAYKKIDQVTATVCNAGIIKTGKAKHATLFLNLGTATNCDPYKTPTVFSAVNIMADADAFAASLVGKTMTFKDVFFKRDKDRERYVAYVAIDQKSERVSVLQGRNSIAIPNLRAGLVRTDSPVEKAVATTVEKTVTPASEKKAVESERNSRSSSPSARPKEKEEGFFSIFRKFFNF